MKKYIEILKKCPLFKGIQEDHLLKMLSCLGARVTKFEKKSTIFSEGETAEYLGIILTGHAQITHTDYNGTRSIINDIQPGELFAEAFACAEVNYLPISVVAEDFCEVMLLNCGHILHTCANHCGFHQQLIFNLMKDLAIKTLLFHQKLEVVSKRTTREKLLAFLSIQSKQAQSRQFEIPFDRQELADYLEVDRSGLSAEISKLRAEGILESNKNRFKLFKGE